MKLKLRRLLACVLAVMLCMAAISIPAFAEGGDYYDSELPANPNPDVITPDGNMTLVSDITGDAANQKEFLTVVSKNGNYFYIIVDRKCQWEQHRSLLESGGRIRSACPAERGRCPELHPIPDAGSDAHTNADTDCGSGTEQV